MDDNLDLREMCCDYLTFEGFRCLGAGDGAEAIRLTRAKRPALILMDASMPGMDGWEATRRLKSDPSTSATPIMMFTAHAYAEHRQLARDVGADAFLAKPVLLDELVLAIRSLLNPLPAH